MKTNSKRNERKMVKKKVQRKTEIFKPGWRDKKHNGNGRVKEISMKEVEKIVETRKSNVK